MKTNNLKEFYKISEIKYNKGKDRIDDSPIVGVKNSFEEKADAERKLQELIKQDPKKYDKPNIKVIPVRLTLDFIKNGGKNYEQRRRQKLEERRQEKRK